MSKVFQALERAEGLRGRRTATVVDPRGSGDGGGPAEPSRLGEYERLAGTILQARAATPFKTLMVAAAHHGEGTSTVAVGLARALAAHVRVLLVDANLRGPVLGEVFHLAPPAGLVDVLGGQAPVAEAVAESGTANLRVMPAGTPADDASRLFLGPRFAQALEELAGDSDVVLLDAPPVLPYADALTIGGKADRVVLVTCAERTQRGDLERAKEELEKSGASILGVVLNRKAAHAPPWMQRYLNP